MYLLQKPFSIEQNVTMVIQSIHSKLGMLVASTQSDLGDQIVTCSFPVSHLY